MIVSDKFIGSTLYCGKNRYGEIVAVSFDFECLEYRTKARWFFLVLSDEGELSSYEFDTFRGYRVVLKGHDTAEGPFR